ncbi:MAG: hypothetical protein AAF628_11385 [Planctomycetota bacterium]
MSRSHRPALWFAAVAALGFAAYGCSAPGERPGERGAEPAPPPASAPTSAPSSRPATSQPSSQPAASPPVVTLDPTQPAHEEAWDDGFLIGVVELPEATAFFKLQGPPAQVAQLRGSLRTLCESVRGHGAELKWVTPTVLAEEPGSGMRRATFRAPAQPDVSGTLVVLGGDGGGLAPNVVRWRQQLGLPELFDDELDAFVEELPRLETAGGWVARIVDLTE